MERSPSDTSVIGQVGVGHRWAEKATRDESHGFHGYHKQRKKKEAKKKEKMYYDYEFLYQGEDPLHPLSEGVLY